MTDRITCPSCSMTASRVDHRHFAPLPTHDDVEARRCRNCGETVLLDGGSVVGLRRTQFSNAG